MSISQQWSFMGGPGMSTGAITVGYQGGEGDPGHRAALRHFSPLHGVTLPRAFDTLHEMLRAVRAREIDCAVLPIDEHHATACDGIFTRFAVVAPDPIEYDIRIPSKTSVLFVTRHEKIGRAHV